ncbi:MAG: diguanylate cyclase [Thermodesulfobacteriota bacterium]
MDVLNDYSLSLEQFVEYLNDEYRAPGSSAEKMSQMERNYGQNVYRDIIFLLTQIEFPPEEARRHWFHILEHRQTLQNSLNREVGLQVAVCDYFTYVHARMKEYVLMDVHRLLQKERSALIDELTGLYNRRFFNQTIQKEVENSKRSHQPFSLVLLDLDDFKGYNDLLGHPAGDQALIELAGILTRTSRAGDFVVRHGGEEFVILLPRANKRQALIAAERCRKAVADHYFNRQEKLRSGNLTVTAGLASFPSDADDAFELFERADQALYRGKSAGRNRVVPWSPEKRSFPRFPYTTDMMFRPVEETVEYQGPCRTRDISLSGALCRYHQPPEIGRFVQVKFMDKEDEALGLRARVVRLAKDPKSRHEYYMGLSFEPASEDEAQALKDVILGITAALH